MRIYIAGPYSIDPEPNVVNAIRVADEISKLGHIPFIPHLTHYWEKEVHHEYEFWMEQDLEWLKVCDGVFRIDGESEGADREVGWAVNNGLPIFYTLSQLQEHAHVCKVAHGEIVYSAWTGTYRCTRCGEQWDKSEYMTTDSE